MPELAAHVLVQRVAGFSNASDLLLSGRIFRGAEAAQMGIVSAALPADQVLDRALAQKDPAQIRTEIAQGGHATYCGKCQTVCPVGTTAWKKPHKAKREGTLS